MGWQDAPVVEDAPKWASAPETAPPQMMVPSGERSVLPTETAAKYLMGLIKGGPMGLVATGVNEAMKGLDGIAYEAGGAATDLAAKALPPEAAAAVGVAANMGVNSLPTAIGGAAGKVAGKGVEGTSRWLMQSALKPSSSAIAKGDAARAIDVMLKEGVNVTPGGAAQLRGMIDDLSRQVAQKIAESPAATVDKGHAARELYGTLNKFKSQVNPGADTQAIIKVWDEFNDLVTSKIPVLEAQNLKQGTYRVLAKKYGQMGSAETEAQKALARGLRKGIEEAVPAVKNLNSKESELLDALLLAERRIGSAANRDVAGMVPLANSPEMMAAMAADRSPILKSIAARMLYQARKLAPAGGAYAGAQYGGTPNE
jgi:hypothetical protein